MVDRSFVQLLPIVTSKFTDPLAPDQDQVLFLLQNLNIILKN